MTRPNGGWRCKYGTWHDLYESCSCAPSSLAVPAVTPTDLPPTDRAHVVVRYAIDEHLQPQLRAVLNNPAETVVRRPRFAKEVSA